MEININFNKTHKTEHFVEKAYLMKDLNFNNVPNYESFLNDDIIEKIKKIYKVDFDNFKLYNINYD